MRSEVRAEIACATSTGTTSISAPKAPAPSSARTAAMIAIACSAVLPTATKPPVHVRRDGDQSDMADHRHRLVGHPPDRRDAGAAIDRVGVPP